MSLQCEICGPENECTCGPCKCQSCTKPRDPVCRHTLFEAWKKLEERPPFHSWADDKTQLVLAGIITLESIGEQS